MNLLSELASQWTDLADILRQKAPEATWTSSIEGTMRCSWPGTACFMLVIEAAVMFRLFDPPLEESLWFLASMFMVAVIGNLLDQIWDIRVDQVCAPHRPLPSGMVSPLFVWHAALAGMTLCWVCAWRTNSSVAVYSITAMTTALFFLPSISRCSKVLGEFVLSLVYSTGIWAPALVAQHLTCQREAECTFGASSWSGLDIWPLALVAVLFHFHRDTALDIADVQGDKAGGLRTIATTFGTKAACWAVFATLIGCLAIPSAIFASVWYKEWPDVSKMVFFVSTYFFIGSCAAGLVLILRESQVESDLEDSPDLEKDIENAKEQQSEDVLADEISTSDDSSQAATSDDSSSAEASDDDSFSRRRSRLRRLMKLELVGYMVWVMVNVLVGYN